MVNASPDKREDLLKDLEQFAFRGIPNLSSPRIQPEPCIEADPVTSTTLQEKDETGSEEQVSCCLRTWKTNEDLHKAFTAQRRTTYLFLCIEGNEGCFAGISKKKAC